jgi:hypothetical protein
MRPAERGAIREERGVVVIVALPALDVQDEYL